MSKRLLLLNLILVSAAVVFSVQLVQIFTSSPGLPAPPAIRAPQAAPRPAEETARPAPPLAAYDAVAARNLFNPSRSETATTPAAAAPKPLLYGIVLRDGAPAAFLEDPVTKKVFGYKPGDQVAGGRLERIETDRVVIRRPDGMLEVLLRDPRKPKAVATAQPGVPAVQPPPPGSGQAQVPTVPRPLPPTLLRRPQPPEVPPVRNAPSP